MWVGGAAGVVGRGGMWSGAGVEGCIVLHFLCMPFIVVCMLVLMQNLIFLWKHT